MKKKKYNGWEKPCPTTNEAIGICVALQNGVYDSDSSKSMSMWEQIHHVISDREVLRNKLEKMKKRGKR